MDRIRTIAACLAFASSVLFLTGCPAGGNNPSGPANTPVPTNTPTVTHTPCTCTPTPTATVPAMVVINVTTSTYPAAVTVAQGGAVIWTNNTGFPHSVHGYDGTGACALSSQLPAGTPVTIIFPSLGTYLYHCQYHSGCLTTCTAPSCSGMVGTVIVQ